jgi:hypothetical protein
VRSDEHVRTARILSFEPVECHVDPLGAPALAQQHPSVPTKNAKVEELDPIERSCLRPIDFELERSLATTSAGRRWRRKSAQILLVALPIVVVLLPFP